MKTIDTVVFDMDGTVLNTLDDLTVSVNYVLDKFGMPKRTLEEYRLFFGNGIRHALELAVPEGTSPEMLDEMVPVFREHYDRHCLDNTKPYDGILNLMTELKRRGYKMAIVSNKIDSAVKELGSRFFSDFVDVAIGEKPGIKRKPAPDTVFEALKELKSGVNEAVYIGDSEVDFATAQNSGLKCISVLWGFRDRKHLEEIGAGIFAEDPEDVLRILDGMNAEEYEVTIQDEAFGEITFDGLNWIKTEPLPLSVAGKVQEFKVEIESPDLVYDWARIGKLKKESADRIFDPNLGGIHYTLARLNQMRDRYLRTFFKNRNSTEHNIRRAFLRWLSETDGNDIPSSSAEETLSSIQLVTAYVFDREIEIKFTCERHEQSIAYFVIPDSGEMSVKPANMVMENLKESIRSLGFDIRESKRRIFYAHSEEIPTKEQIRGILDLFTENVEMSFWNYYHRKGVEPGSYIDIQILDGKPYIKEGTHGCNGNYKNVDMDVLLGFIIRNWDKDCDWGLYDHAVAIQPSKSEYVRRDVSGRKPEFFTPDYSVNPW
ncbi:MAG: HAD family hydrolase [Lachnospiraceae bacterium]|nr:HAD family hydrolase [Lachnospiraceae bacterium]